jgi:hypothetical protein
MRRYTKFGIGFALGMDHTTICYHTMRRDKKTAKNQRDWAAYKRGSQNDLQKTTA